MNHADDPSVLLATGIEREPDAKLIARAFMHYHREAVAFARVEEIGGSFSIFGLLATPENLPALLAYGAGARDILRAAAGGMEPAEKVRT